MTEAPLTIGMPTSTFLPALGGVEIGLHNIASRLSARGHAPIILAPARNVLALREQRDQLPYKLAAFPPKMMTLIHHWPDLGTRFISAWLAWFDRRHAIDAWHGTVGFPTGVGLIRHATGKRPHLVRCAGDDIQVAPEIGYGMRLDPRVDRLVRQWLPRADILVAITESVAQEYAKLGVPPERIRRIPNGVDLDRFGMSADRADIRRRHGIPEDAFLFLAVGRNHPKKGYTDLLRATRILGERSAAGFAVAIAGAATNELVSDAQNLGISEQVHLLGALGQASADGDLKLPGDDLVSLYRAADAFVFPSHIETFGIALVEAMAAGLPIITTDGPGCRDIIENGTWGEMVPVGDTSALASAMHQMMDEPDRRRTRIEQSRERAGAFSWDRIVDQYVEVYRDTMAMNR
ncbi:MAG: glycosyltransferase family 4 protein [Rhodospirillaceae bacterium]|jgi:glycosyltransferase involved in cell wall biosynthesis|nr:glycosyltransferase family 4 protein [Rhodospirillaceae bacterium]MBT5946003.1 glycosyltransferase family 4 protein [Rhodospirillaceae bacterium]MBT6405279.1 glycosyltransferase family 4 protein [Rhodospirillaceae bacterium]MBT7360570.1 glycosyltransferase family 4 protein [Rhodospirillaceae bacterium]